jgi:hypothetical protein
MVLKMPLLGEGIVSLTPIAGATDDHVVKKMKAHGLGGFG